jgi:hypothetical protein
MVPTEGYEIEPLPWGIPKESVSLFFLGFLRFAKENYSNLLSQ